MEQVLTFLEDPIVRSLATLAGAVLLALLLDLILGTWVLKLTAKTQTDLDDRMVAALRRPLFVTVILLGIAGACYQFQLKPYPKFVIYAALKSAAILVWALALVKFSTVLLGVISRHASTAALVQPRTLPLFEIIVKVVVVGGGVYFAFLAWNINVTGWLASAGIVGIAVGFAAKDTLANLFAGFFILADAPYKLGDFIVLDNSLRGQVTDIGIRSTRILTRDDIEITVPNAVIANSKIINETGGPWDKERVRVKVGVAYGSDVDQVRAILLDCAKDMTHVCEDPYPRVRFRAFGGSALNFELLAWIDEPVLRGRVLDALNCRVYKALNVAGVEIPYTKYDVYIKKMPGMEDGEEAPVVAKEVVEEGTVELNKEQKIKNKK